MDINDQLHLHYEGTVLTPPYMLAAVIPKCPACFANGVVTPNPQALPNCPTCGEPAPAPTQFIHVPANQGAE